MQEAERSLRPCLPCTVPGCGAWGRAPALPLSAARGRGSTPTPSCTTTSYGVARYTTGATIQEASLAITVTSRTQTTWLKLELYPVLRSWLESQATWNVAQSGVNWTSAGCNGVGSDRAATPVATVTVDTAAGKVTMPGLAGLVQSWVNNPGGNAGLLLRPQANTGGATMTYNFASSQYWTEGDRPALTVKYMMGTALAAYEAEVKAEVEAEPQAPAAVVTKYYHLGNTRVAMRQADALYYLFGDHLGSTTLTYNPTTGATARQLYMPYGAARWPSPSTLPTDYRFTGQRSEEATLGSLYDYGARFYSPYLNRWIQPDPIVPDPGNPQSLNRYSYCLNNPLKYTDPDGHIPVPLITGGVGALVAGGGDLGKQLIVDHRNIRDVNWAETGGAAAGGFVAGATLGLAPAGASVVGLTLLGGVSSGAGGQVQAVTQAGLERLMGRTQASVLEEGKNLGFLDPRSIVIDTGAGMVMGGAGGKFAGWLRSKLPLPESAAVIQRSGELPMVRWMPQLDKPGIWTVQMEGRTISIDANVFERMVRSAAIGGYDAAEKILTEAIQQGTVTIIKDKAQP
jgi:RHS repeat-associated protein